MLIANAQIVWMKVAMEFEVVQMGLLQVGLNDAKSSAAPLTGYFLYPAAYTRDFPIRHAARHSIINS